MRVILADTEVTSGEDRSAVKDDIKLIAQACVEPEITMFATSDKRLLNKIDYLVDNAGVRLGKIDTSVSYSSVLGVLKFDE